MPLTSPREKTFAKRRCWRVCLSTSTKPLAAASSAVAAGALARDLRICARCAAGGCACLFDACFMYAPRMQQGGGVPVQLRLLWVCDCCIQLPGARLCRQGAGLSMHELHIFYFPHLPTPVQCVVDAHAAESPSTDEAVIGNRAHACAVRSGCTACKRPEEASVRKRRFSFVSCSPNRALREWFRSLLFQSGCPEGVVV